MSTPTSSHEPPRAPSLAVRALISIAVAISALTIFAIGSLALFSDQAIVTGDGIGTGTVDLASSPASAVVSAPSVRPGDQVTSTLDITNTGSLEVRYVATTTTTEDGLAAQLQLTVKVGVTDCRDGAWAVDGTTLYQGPLGSTASLMLFGDPAAGADPGDRVLAAGATEQLCLNVLLPSSTRSIAQGRSTSATFDFVAEQTVNNP